MKPQCESVKPKLLDLWLPPANAGSPIGCIATSFTFDQDFFESSCISRFLTLDTHRGESSEAAAAVAEEEAFSEARVTVLLDQSQANKPDARNLRWDLLPVPVPGALLHAKLTLLQWENVLRILVGSANLTPAGYRSQAEVVMAFEAYDGSEVPRQVFDELLDAASAILDLAPGATSSPGPKARTATTLDGMRAFLDGLALEPERRRGDPHIRVCMTGPGRQSLFSQLAETWRGARPARDAFVMSPFYDTGPSVNQTAQGLQSVMAQRGDRSVHFLMRVDEHNAETIARAPAALRDSFGTGPAVSFSAFRTDDAELEPRRLHGKAMLLRSDSWLTALFGSSNFTAKGTGVASQPHVEVNVAIGAPWTSEIAELLWQSVPDGEPFEPGDAIWEPGLDDEDASEVPLPLGFVEALLEPGEPAQVHFTLDAAVLPPWWSVTFPGSPAAPGYDSTHWVSQGEPGVARFPAPEGTFFLQVDWEDAGVRHRGWMVLNVTDPSKLPPPEALKGLTLDELIRALASTRPFREPVQQSDDGPAANGARVDPDLDPLKRFTNSGLLLQRVRRFVRALQCLRTRLERPAHSLEALRWRLFGPLGPAVVAESIAKEGEPADPGPVGLSGERAFMLAELALMLGQVDWRTVAGEGVPLPQAMDNVADLQERIRSMSRDIEQDPALGAYVDHAFARAAR